MAKADVSQMAPQIIAGFGGKENMASINHCATRLRVNVNDIEKVDQAALKKVKGVIALDIRNGEVQVIVGPIIEDLYLAVEKAAGGGGKVAEAKQGKKTPSEIFGGFLMMMAGILSPIIPALIASGLLSTVLTVMTLVLKVDATTSPTYAILYNLSQTVFYFLPVLVAYTAAKKFDTEPILAAVLACFLLYPGWVEAAAQGGFTSYFGLPVLRTTYNGAVIQIILSVFVMAWLDRLLKRIIPEAARHFLKPFLLLLLMSVITLTVTGPLGGLFTDYIYAGVTAVRNVAPWAGVPVIILLSTTIGLVAPGFHLALIPIATASLAAVGYDDLINIWFFCCTITPGFISLAVALRSKNSTLRQIAFPASLSALLGGISEPTTYGICYKMVKPYYAYFITALSTGVLAGLLNLKCYAFGGYSLTNILLYLGPNLDTANFRNAVILVAYMAVMSFVTVNLIGFDDSVYNEDEEAEKLV
ncbi:MAG: PTS transporter subunit EIIC [Gemmiger sp.]|nr:PTS transporter subunit EIIC [Gemmiger sp.]